MPQQLLVRSRCTAFCHFYTHFMNKVNNFFRKIGSRHYNVLLLLFIIGVFLIYIAQFIVYPYDHVCRDIGIAFFPISVIGFAYEYILRQSFIKGMEAQIKIVVDDRMPSSLKHLRDSGVVDAYPILDTQNLCEHIVNSKNVEIKILDIWFEYLHLIKEDIIKAIVSENCSVRIMIWDIRNKDVLKRRSKSLGFEEGASTLMGYIVDNLRTLDSMQRRLAEIDPSSVGRLQIKLYSSFIGISLFGIGPDYYLGFYLREKLSSQGTQFKVSGYNRFFYHQIDDHFERQWNDDEENVVFTGALLEDYKKIYKDYVLRSD